MELKESIAVWETFRREHLKNTEALLEFKYAETPTLLIEALTFWLFVRTQLITVGLEANITVTAAERRLILQSFMTEGNPYIVLIARIEMFPDEVFQKVIWRGNIDFPSREAFLRRIDPDQQHLIALTYEELYGEQADTVSVPTVYKMSLRDRLLFFLKRKTKASVMEGGYGYNERYLSRDAWVFNLLDLDFGFSLYSKGVTDDTKITNKKFTRFFSIKEHINDFVVNKLDGKYWWLYRTVRSNYVWRPSKKVRLGTHVCPGFWWTLIVHLYFWIVSPLLFAAAVVEYQHLPWYLILLAVFPTPLFIVLVLLKRICVFIADHSWIVRKCAKAVREWKKKHYTFIRALENVGAVFLISLVAIGGTAVVCYATYEYGKSLLQDLGIPPTEMVLVVSASWFNVGWFISTRERHYQAEKYSSLPRWVQGLSVVALAIVVLKLYDRFIAQYVERTVAAIGRYFSETVWGFIIHTPWIAAGFALSLAMIVLSTRCIVTVYKDEKKFALQSTFIRWGTLGGVFLAACCFYIGRHAEYFLNYETPEMMSLVSEVLAFALFGALCTMLYTIPINDQTIKKREVSKTFLNEMYKRFSETFLKHFSTSFTQSYYKEFRLSPAALLRNEWLMSGSETARSFILIKLLDTLGNLPFDKNANSEAIADFANDFLLDHLPSLTKDKFHQLKKMNKFLTKRRALSIRELEVFIAAVFKGYSFNQAWDKVLGNHLKKQKKAIYFQLFIEHLLYAWLCIQKPFVWIGRKISQLKDLWDLFNKHCPFISESKVLR